MDLFDLAAKITLDSSEYERGLDQAVKKTKGIGSAISGILSGLAIGAAVTSTVKAVADLTKSAVSAYAEYEQLVGGVETLFKESAEIVQEYAADAYRTAGLSANEYMETVTSFSASLLQSLGGDTQKAAEIADMAIRDMSDNANKMGTAMESIQVAYQGFAKQNYTMLDNLKLGYGGTQSEMKRLLADATAISGVSYDISSLNDVYSAIHVIQEELGITGTTAKEASETIQGSLAAMKSAWKNLITGIADENADFDKLVDRFVDSVVTAGGNLTPRIEQAVKGIGTLVDRLAPVIAERLPGLLSSILPSLMDSAVSTILALVKGVSQNLSTILKAVVDVAIIIIEGVADALPEMLPAIVDAILTIVDLLTSPETMEKLINAGFKLIGGLVEGLLKAQPEIDKGIFTIIDNLVASIGNLHEMVIKAGYDVLKSFVSGIIGIDAVEEIEDAVKGVFDNLQQGFMDIISKAPAWGRNLIMAFVDGMIGMMSVTTPIFSTLGIASNFDYGFNGGVSSSGVQTKLSNHINTDAIVTAVRDGLSGATVSMDGRKVGMLVSNYQQSTAMARG